MLIGLILGLAVERTPIDPKALIPNWSLIAQEMLRIIGTACATFVLALTVGEIARRRGLWGQSQWDSDKIKFDIRKELQLRRIEILKSMANDIPPCYLAASTARTYSLSAHKAGRGSDDWATFVNMAKAEFQKAKRVLEHLSQLAQEYGNSPPNREGIPVNLHQLCNRIARDVDRWENWSQIGDADPASESSVNGLGSVIAWHLAEEQRILLETAPGNVEPDFRLDSSHRPSLNYLNKENRPVEEGGEPGTLTQHPVHGS